MADATHFRDQREKMHGRIATYSSGEAAEIVGAPSERWFVQQLRAGRFPGRKVGRHWRLTERDLKDALEACANGAGQIGASPPARAFGLTATSRKKLLASQRPSKYCGQARRGMDGNAN